MSDAAMYVQGGVYTIKAEIKDPFGGISTLTKQVTVLPGGTQQWLRIYNSAGEVVRSVKLGSIPGAARLSTDGSFGLELDANGAPLSSLKIDVEGNSGVQTTGWNGLNDLGVPVASGAYNIQLVSIEGGREVVVTARTVIVIKVNDPMAVLESALVAPNPVPATDKEIRVYYNPALLMGYRAKAQLYNLAGELVSESADAGNTGVIYLATDRAISGGIYLVRFQILSGPALYKARVIKAGIIR